MENISKILKNTGLFAGIEEENIDRLLGCLSARAAEFKKDVYIMSMGEKPSDVGIVLSGSVNIISEDYWGNRTIIAKATAGELFAEAFSCADVKNSPSASYRLKKQAFCLLITKRSLPPAPPPASFILR